MTRRKLLFIVQAIAAAALIAVGMANAGAAAKTTKLKAQLTNGQEIPHVKAMGGTGRFTATLTRKATGGTLKWRLTFSHLTGKPFAAHIHKAPRGKPGPILISLCGPCTSPVTGTSPVTTAEITAILKGKTYVNVHTAKNKNGEIRGQITKAL